MLDCNEDVRTGKFTTIMKEELGLVETVTAQHGPDGPPTYERGSTPIDGIYVSSTLQGLRCGYLDFTFDHRCLWMDIPAPIAFGHTIPPSIARRARRLNCNGPRIVKRYLDVLTSYLEERNMFARVDALFAETSFPLTIKQAREWEGLDKLHMIGLQLADSKCRKFRTGDIPWSPQYQVIRSRIEFWNLMVKKLSGGRVHGYYLRRKAHNAKLQDQLACTDLQKAKDMRAIAYREDKRLRKTAWTSRKKWIEELAEAKALQGNLSAAKHIEQMLRIEKQRRDARII